MSHPTHVEELGKYLYMYNFWYKMNTKVFCSDTYDRYSLSPSFYIYIFKRYINFFVQILRTGTLSLSLSIYIYIYIHTHTHTHTWELYMNKDLETDSWRKEQFIECFIWTDLSRWHIHSLEREKCFWQDFL